MSVSNRVQKQISFGEAVAEVLGAASDVAAERAKEVVSNRLDGLFTNGILPKTIAFLGLFIAAITALYGALFHGIKVLLQGLVPQPYLELSSHGLILVAGIIGMCVTQKLIKESWDSRPSAS